MKKHLIAVAVAAAVAAPAMAQNVSLSGLIDMGYGMADAPGANQPNTARVATNGSATTAILITGSEDLGGGMRANFRYEMNPDFQGGTGLAAATGANGYNFVGLSGGFGDVKVGRLNTPTLAAWGIGQVFGTALGGGYSTAVGGIFTRYTAATTGVHTAPTRFNNAIEYSTPTLNGLQGRFLMVPKNENGAAASTSNRPAVTDIGLSYAAGPLNLMFAQQEVKNGSIAEATSDPLNGVLGATADAKNKLQTIAGSYALGNLTLRAARFSEKTTVATARDLQGFVIGARYAQGALAYTANYGKSDDGTTANVDRRIIGVGVDYSLSKRSTIYGRYVTADNNTNSSTDDTTNGIDRKSVV